MKGQFYTFEGIDGSGKTTLIEYLKKKCSHKKHYWTREPYGTSLERPIKDILQQATAYNDPLTQYLAFAMERSFHIKNTIIPELEKGRTVISDRFFYSSLAYQGLTINPDIITAIYNNTNHNITINNIFYCKIKPEKALARMQKRGKNFLDTYFEEKAHTLAKRYDTLFQDKKNVITIDMEDDANIIFKNIKEYFI